MKSKKWIWIGLGVGLVLLLVVMNVIRQSQGSVEAVQFARVRVEDITSRVRAPGKIEPKTQVKISADLPGRVQDLLVKEGDRVRKGQLMLQLNDTQYRANYVQSKAALSTAAARLREAEQGAKVSDSNISRQRALYEQKLLSAAEWDQATSGNESAHATLAACREEIARSQGAVDAAQDNVNKCHFLAPFDGVVSALDVEKGEMVIIGTMNNPGTEIMVVSDLSRMLVRADVDETDVVDMKLGQKAKITVDAMPDTSFHGTVLEIGNTAKRSSASAVEGQTNFEVKVVFDDDIKQIRPGMTADVEIETATHPKAVGVPIQAVVVRTQRELDRAAHKSGDKPARRKKGEMVTAEDDTVGRKEKEITGVFLVKNGTASFIPVRTGIASETTIEIFGSVKEGDVVVAGPYKALRELKPGSKVKQEQAAKGAAGGKT
jgi:HlyD family secretion protein